MVDYSRPGLHLPRFPGGSVQFRTITWDFQAATASGWIVNFNNGLFTRNSSGSYLTSAPTTGSPGFISFAAPNILRFEDRGDGAGALALIEGLRTNEVNASREWTVTGGSFWVAAGSGVQLENKGPGPDAADKADSLVCGLGQFGNYMTTTDTSNVYVGSSWARASGAITSQMRMALGTNSSTPQSIGFQEAILTTTYQRLTATFKNSVTWATRTFVPHDGTTYVGAGGTGTMTASLLGDMHQLESGSFASSYIFTSSSFSTSGAARQADFLSFSAASYDSRLISASAQFEQISPAWPSILTCSINNEFWLLSFSGSNQNGIRFFKVNDSSVRMEIISQSVNILSSSNLAWNAHALLGPMEWSPETGKLQFSGVTKTGNPWTWPNTDLRIGGLFGQFSESFCRLGTLRSGTIL